MWLSQNHGKDVIIDIDKNEVKGLEMRIHELTHHGVVMDKPVLGNNKIMLRPMHLRSFRVKFVDL
jgi:hypothetical protein